MHLPEIDFYQNICCRGCNSNKSPLVNSNGSAPGRRQGHVEFRMIRRPLWFYRSRVRDFLFTQIPGHSPIKIWKSWTFPSLKISVYIDVNLICLWHTWGQNLPLQNSGSKNSVVCVLNEQYFAFVFGFHFPFLHFLIIPFPDFQNNMYSAGPTGQRGSTIIYCWQSRENSPNLLW